MFAGRLIRAAALAAAAAIGAAFGGTAADAGPFEVATGTYKFVARNEPLVANDRQIDIWAEIYRPATLPARPMPLVVFLHGNHGTCGRFDDGLGVRVDDRSDYTDTGACPRGYVVTPNHLGYAYLARELASFGYLVVSINANRGITAGDGVSGDFGLNLMRGRLILLHLAVLSDWNRGAGSLAPPSSLGFDPKGTIDFSQVGLMGHSRGGEGARAALQQYRDAGSPFPSLIGPLRLRSIFEIAPVDGQTDRTLDADGVDSVILLPTCDGDVSDLQGVHVFDRTFTRGSPADKVTAIHGTFMVYGANHNAYNTEWLLSDSPGCDGAAALFPDAGRSGRQQATALGSLVPFFRATVGDGAKAARAALFDPTAPLPDALTAVTRYDRGYLPGPINKKTVVLESFGNSTGFSDAGVATTTVGVDVVHQQAPFEHDSSVRVAEASWDGSSPATRFFQVNFDPAGRDLSAYDTFAFRVTLKCFAKVCRKPASDAGEMDFTVSLVGPGGQSRQISIAGRTRLSRPVGSAGFGNVHSILQTVAIPLSDFGLPDLGKVTGVRFTFEKKGVGVVDITDLTASTFPVASADAQLGAEDAIATASDAGFAPASGSRPVSTPAADGNRIAIVRGEAAPGARAEPGAVAVVLTSKRAFPVTGALPRLTVGGKTIRGGDISRDGKSITFRVPAAEFGALQGDVSLDIQASSAVWTFGPLPK